MLLAATPAWLADNTTQIALGLLLVATVGVLRLAQKTATRVTLVALLAGAAVFVYANRVELKACARTCECRLAEQDVTVPFCNPDLDL